MTKVTRASSRGLPTPLGRPSRPSLAAASPQRRTGTGGGRPAHSRIQAISKLAQGPQPRCSCKSRIRRGRGGRRQTRFHPTDVPRSADPKTKCHGRRRQPLRSGPGGEQMPLAQKGPGEPRIGRPERCSPFGKSACRQDPPLQGGTPGAHLHDEHLHRPARPLPELQQGLENLVQRIAGTRAPESFEEGRHHGPHLPASCHGHGLRDHPEVGGMSCAARPGRHLLECVSQAHDD